MPKFCVTLKNACPITSLFALPKAFCVHCCSANFFVAKMRLTKSGTDRRKFWENVDFLLYWKWVVSFDTAAAWRFFKTNSGLNDSDVIESLRPASDMFDASTCLKQFFKVGSRKIHIFQNFPGVLFFCYPPVCMCILFTWKYRYNFLWSEFLRLKGHWAA